MQPSKDLRELMMQSYAAMASAKGSFFDEHFSRADGVLAIGTDPNEWWSGHDTIQNVFIAQLEEAGGFAIAGGSPIAFEEGSIGWIADEATLTIPGVEFPVRITAVCRKEPDGWKFIQWHASIGVPNDGLGELPT